MRERILGLAITAGPYPGRCGSVFNQRELVADHPPFEQLAWVGIVKLHSLEI